MVCFRDNSHDKISCKIYIVNLWKKLEITHDKSD